jgi:transmembrane sensor
MKELYDKYTRNELTKQDLEELRNQDATTTDVELEKFLWERWSKDDIDTAAVTDEVQLKTKRNIDKRIAAENKPVATPLYMRVMAWAAAVMLPILMFFTYNFIQQNGLQQSTAEMVVSTNTGEKASVILPDGTKVALNSDSRLKYTPASYRNERNVKFSGEAYFQVAKDKRHPFVISANNLSVKVLGTTFNLSVRPNDATAELALKTGKVLFSSLQMGNSAVILPNHKVTMNQHTGKLNVSTIEPDEISPWMRNEMVFRNAKISQVLRSIETNYGVKIHINAKDSNDLFTGTLASNDLKGVLEVLELSYHLKASQKGNDIFVSKIN